MEFFNFILFCGSLITSSMGFVDIDVFFPNIEKNLTEVVWAHAVNSATYLNDTLAKNEIMMLEADVQLGTLPNQSEIIPIMSHTKNVSDLSLETFFKKVDDHNRQNQKNTTKKGIKLDFKKIDAFLKSLDIIRAYNKQANYPVWISADILFGPISIAGEHPVNASQFLEGAKSIETAWLSLGWATIYGPYILGQYGDHNIDEMFEVLNQHKPKNRITFSVRAGLAETSITLMKSLVRKRKDYTLTIWSQDDDYVKVNLLRSLIRTIGVDKVFIDLPDSIKSQLNLNNVPKPSSAWNACSGFLPIILILALAIF